MGHLAHLRGDRDQGRRPRGPARRPERHLLERPRLRLRGLRPTAGAARSRSRRSAATRTRPSRSTRSRTPRLPVRGRQRARTASSTAGRRRRGVKLEPGIANRLGDTAGTLEAMAIIMDDGSVLPDVAYLTSAQLGRPFPVKWVDGARAGRPDHLGAQAVHRRRSPAARSSRACTAPTRASTSSTASRSTPATCPPTRSSTTAWSGSTPTPTRRSRWSPTSRTRPPSDTGTPPRYDGVVFDGPDNVTSPRGARSCSPRTASAPRTCSAPCPAARRTRSRATS